MVGVKCGNARAFATSMAMPLLTELGRSAWSGSPPGERVGTVVIHVLRGKSQLALGVFQAYCLEHKQVTP